MTQRGRAASSLVGRLRMTLGPTGQLLRVHERAFRTWLTTMRGDSLHITELLTGHRIVVRQLQADQQLSEAATGWLDIAGLPAVSRATGIPLDPLVIGFEILEELGPLTRLPLDQLGPEREARRAELLTLQSELEERWVRTP